jgi:GTP-binding protein
MTQHIDSINIVVTSGKGGPGCISFRREKYIDNGGPDGGDGGKGGDVILQGNEKFRSLLDLKRKHRYKAQCGQPGLTKKRYGSQGQSITINVPLGTLIYDENDTLICDITRHNQKIYIAKGGLGGQGNTKFASSIKRTPRYAQPGQAGKEKKIRLELKLIAQIGIIGLPSAGKSTLLKTLTMANAKIGAYPFTTLYPNLGTLRYYDQELILTDIPGLIEGSSQGKGLGNHFLRHIDRTELLVHLVEGTNTTEDCLNAFHAINKELKQSKYNIESKPKLIVISKIDTIPTDQLNTIIAQFKKIGVSPLTLSSLSNIGVDILIKKLYTLYNQISTHTEKNKN